MKKFFTVLLWLCLAASVVALFTMAGEKASLSDEARKNKQKYDALKTMYDREKADWLASADELNADNAALALEKQALAAALKEARQEADAARNEGEALTAEKNEISGRVSDILALLTSGPEAAPAETPKETPQPKRPVLPSHHADALPQ